MQNSRQQLFDDMFKGVLLYSVVLGFFNDYTTILHTKSYSVTFAVAIVMQILTYLTFAAKDKTVELARGRDSRSHKVRIGLSVWLVMFLSKFVFLEAISIIFRGEVQISNFVGLLIIIVTMTVAQRLIELAYRLLGR